MIPIHLIGNIYGQELTGLGDLLKPFPDATKVDLSAEMVKQVNSQKNIFS